MRVLSMEKADEKVMQEINPFTFKEVQDALSALKKESVWTVRDDSKYRHEAVAQYLQLSLVTKGKNLMLEPGLRTTLQYLLSWQRKLCLILSPKQHKKDADKLKKVLGRDRTHWKIIVVSTEQLRDNEDERKSVLECDAILASPNVFDEVCTLFNNQMLKDSGKTILKFSTIGTEDEIFSRYHSLRHTTEVSFDLQRNAILIKVASNVFTTYKISANILCVLLAVSKLFPGGWKNFKSAGLIAGVSEVTINLPIGGDMDKFLEGHKMNLDRYVKEYKKLEEENAAKKMAMKKEALLLSKKGERKSKGCPRKKKATQLAEESVQQPAQDLVNTLLKGAIQTVYASDSEQTENTTSKKKKAHKRQLDDSEKTNGQADISPGKKSRNGSNKNAGAAGNKKEEVTGTPGNQSQKKKNKKNKVLGDAEKFTSIQTNGELSAEFKQNLMSSLKKVTRGTELEDVVVKAVTPGSPKKSEKIKLVDKSLKPIQTNGNTPKSSSKNKLKKAGGNVEKSPKPTPNSEGTEMSTSQKKRIRQLLARANRRALAGGNTSQTNDSVQT